MTGAILLTGGLGYLGGRLLRHLQDQNLGALRATGRHPPPRPPKWAAGVNLFRADLDQPQTLERACDGVETVIHLAAMNAAACAADPAAADRINIGGTRSLIAAAERAGVARIIYFSTAHVYGAPLAGVLCETSPTRNDHPYASTRRAAEDVVRQSSLQSLVFRLSNGFGAPADAGADCWMLVINDICRQVVTNRRIVLRGTGQERRDFITLADVLRAVSHFLRLPARHWADGLYNLGAGRTRSVIEMAEWIAQRSRAVLGLDPGIERKRPNGEGAAGDLDYRIDKLLATGFALEDDGETEIDETLKLCQAAFG